MVKHNEDIYPGLHDALISREVFDTVQLMLRKNSGRSETLNPRPARGYLLKGLIRCAYCGLPMWAQTYKNGGRYYREHRNSRGIMECPASGGSVPSDLADEQVGMVIEAIALQTDWMDQVMALINVQDDVEAVRERRRQLEEKLRRLGKAYVNGMYSDSDFDREKRYVAMEMESLVVPEADAAVEAGRLMEDLPLLWEEAPMPERRKLLLSILDGVYFDTKGEKALVAITPKLTFLPIFQVAVTLEGSLVLMLKEKDLPPSLPGSEADPSGPRSWWRQGGVDLPLKHRIALWVMPGLGHLAAPAHAMTAVADLAPALRSPARVLTTT